MHILTKPSFQGSDYPEGQPLCLRPQPERVSHAEVRGEDRQTSQPPMAAGGRVSEVAGTGGKYFVPFASHRLNLSTVMQYYP